MHRLRLFALCLALFAPAFGCGDKSCKNACDKVNSCQLKSSGFSCDSNCKAPLDNCAVCVNDKSCDDIRTGKCASDCPNVSFTNQ